MLHEQQSSSTYPMKESHKRSDIMSDQIINYFIVMLDAIWIYRAFAARDDSRPWYAKSIRIQANAF